MKTRMRPPTDAYEARMQVLQGIFDYITMDGKNRGQAKASTDDLVKIITGNRVSTFEDLMTRLDQEIDTEREASGKSGKWMVLTNNKFLLNKFFNDFVREYKLHKAFDKKAQVRFFHIRMVSAAMCMGLIQSSTEEAAVCSAMARRIDAKDNDKYLKILYMLCSRPELACTMTVDALHANIDNLPPAPTKPALPAPKPKVPTCDQRFLKGVGEDLKWYEAIVKECSSEPGWCKERCDAANANALLCKRILEKCQLGQIDPTAIESEYMSQIKPVKSEWCCEAEALLTKWRETYQQSLRIIHFCTNRKKRDVCDATMNVALGNKSAYEAMEAAVNNCKEDCTYYEDGALQALQAVNLQDLLNNDANNIKDCDTKKKAAIARYKALLEKCGKIGDNDVKQKWGCDNALINRNKAELHNCDKDPFGIVLYPDPQVNVSDDCAEYYNKQVELYNISLEVVAHFAVAEIYRGLTPEHKEVVDVAMQNLELFKEVREYVAWGCDGVSGKRPSLNGHMNASNLCKESGQKLLQAAHVQLAASQAVADKCASFSPNGLQAQSPALQEICADAKENMRRFTLLKAYLENSCQGPLPLQLKPIDVKAFQKINDCLAEKEKRLADLGKLAKKYANVKSLLPELEKSKQALAAYDCSAETMMPSIPNDTCIDQILGKARSCGEIGKVIKRCSALSNKGPKTQAYCTSAQTAHAQLGCDRPGGRLHNCTSVQQGADIINEEGLNGAIELDGPDLSELVDKCADESYSTFDEDKANIFAKNLKNSRNSKNMVALYNDLLNVIRAALTNTCADTAFALHVIHKAIHALWTLDVSSMSSTSMATTTTQNRVSALNTLRKLTVGQQNGQVPLACQVLGGDNDKNTALQYVQHFIEKYIENYRIIYNYLIEGKKLTETDVDAAVAGIRCAWLNLGTVINFFDGGGGGGRNLLNMVLNPGQVDVGDPVAGTWDLWPSMQPNDGRYGSLTPGMSLPLADSAPYPIGPYSTASTGRPSTGRPSTKRITGVSAGRMGITGVSADRTGINAIGPFDPPGRMGGSQRARATSTKRNGQNEKQQRQGKAAKAAKEAKEAKAAKAAKAP